MLLEFNTSCKVLGVQLDLKQSGDRLCFVTNTEERVEEFTNELDEALAPRHLPGVKGRTFGAVLVRQLPSFRKKVQETAESFFPPRHSREKDIV